MLKHGDEAHGSNEMWKYQQIDTISYASFYFLKPQNAPYLFAFYSDIHLKLQYSHVEYLPVEYYLKVQILPVLAY